MNTLGRIMKILFFFVVALFVSTTIAHAGTVGPVGGPYVPVYDKTTNTNFKEYIDKFDDQFGATKPDGKTDSLRDLIAGEEPSGLAVAPCKRGDNLEGFPNKAIAYTDGPWADAVASSSTGKPLPSEIPAPGKYVQINYSHSLRCLLQETVEWQKLGLSIQIHTLLKNYISDAQSKQLNNQLKNKIAAANLDWSRSGNETDDGGVLTTAPVFSTNVSQSQYNQANRQLEHITAQASADPLAMDPVGSLGIADHWRLQSTAAMVNNSQLEAEDPFNYTQSATQETLSTEALNPNDFGKFMGNFNDPSNLFSGMQTFDSMLSNPANSPIGSDLLVSNVALKRLKAQKEVTKQKQTSTGFIPASQCSGAPGDPYCLDQQYSLDTNPAGQNQQMVTDQAKQGDDQVRDGNTLDSKGGPAAETQSTELNTGGGVLTYDTLPLATSTTVVNELVQEMYDVMYRGYFGVQPETSEWSQATMLMIYDEMKFNDAEPEVVVTDDTAADPTGY